MIRLVRIFLVALVLIVGCCGSRLIAGGMVTITPQFIFMDGTQRSIPVNVSNPSTETVEVWFEFRYGYNANDSANNVTVLMPDTVAPGEPSAASWIRAFPNRFTLGPQESQTIRLLVEAPPGVSAGEYWSRVLVVSKPMNGPTINGRPTRGTSIQLIVKTGVPMLYRTGIVDTHIKLLRPPEFKTDAKSFTIQLPLRREGNASYWGSIECQVKNSSGKQVLKQDFKVVVYKDFVLPMKMDRSELPAGDYTVTLISRTTRPDIKASYLIQSEPVTWSFPVRIQ